MAFKDNYYLVRTGNSLTDIKKWISWAKKTSPKQRFILVNNYALKMKTKDKEYWKSRFNGGLEDKYYVYGSY